MQEAAKHYGEQIDKKQKAINYFSNNKSRMKYAEYRKCGFYIGSGMAESGCKQVITELPLLIVQPATTRHR